LIFDVIRVINGLCKVYYLFISVLICRFHSLIELVKNFNLAILGCFVLISVSGVKLYLDAILIFWRRLTLVDIAQRIGPIELWLIFDELRNRDSIIHHLVLLSGVSQPTLGPTVSHRGIGPIHGNLLRLLSLASYRLGSLLWR
jgi:hypothetical protein